MKLGIGARITAVFGLGALILSILMGGLSYFTVRHFLLAGRESAAQHQTFTNASARAQLAAAGNTAYVGLLSNIDAGTDAHSVLFHGSKTYDSSLTVTAGVHPPPAAQRRPRRHGGHADATAPRRGRPRSWSGSRSRPCRPTTSTSSTCPTSTTRCGCSPSPSLSPASSPPSSGSRSAASPAHARCARWPWSRGRPAPSPGATSTPGSMPRRPTPTSRASPSRSTPWSTSCRSASSARRASTPT